MHTRLPSSILGVRLSRPGDHRGHRRASLVLLICFVAGLLFAPRPAGAQSIDQVAAQAKVNGYVTDLASVLSQPAKDQLTALCTEVDQKAQAQIAVVTLKSLGGRPIEDYSIDLATRLGVGPKSNRGVLILFAVDDHRYRFEVGYGLEPILPDGKVGGFGREAVPYLRDNNYDAAILLMTRRVADVIAADRGVTLTATPGMEAPPETGNQNLGGLGKVILVLFVLFFFLGVIRFFRMAAAGGGHRGSGWWIGPMIGSGMGGGGWGGGFGGGGGGGGGFGGFGGGSFGGGGASGSW